MSNITKASRHLDVVVMEFVQEFENVNFRVDSYRTCNRKFGIRELTFIDPVSGHTLEVKYTGDPLPPVIKKKPERKRLSHS